MAVFTTMSSPSDFPTNAPGKVFINVQLLAAPGKADELQELLSAVRRRASSDAEPGCRAYHTVRSFVKDGSVKFAVFEEYDNIAAIKAHTEGEPFKALVAAGTELLSVPPQIEYFYEFE